MSTISKEQRFKLIPSVYLILVKGSKVLLTRRFQTGYCDGFYSLPAGHLDGNETARAGLIREVKEEIGLALNQESLTFRHFMHRLAEDERVDFFFTANNFLGEPKIMEPEKCDDLSWFDWNNLPSNTIPYIKQAIECTVKGIFYSEHGW